MSAAGRRPFRFALQPVSAEVRVLQVGDALRQAARDAESLGYEELYVPDHFGSVDPFVAMMVAAEATTTLRVGTLVLNNEFHHPAMLARTAATIDRLTDGRLVLGCGTGYMQSEHDATGIELRAPRERVDRFEESIRALRSLLDTGAVTMSGMHHQLAIERLGVEPVQPRVPILIGGHGRRVVGIAGRHCDIYQFTGLTHGEGGVPKPGGFAMSDLLDRAAWLAEAAGDRIDEIERSMLVQMARVGEDTSAAMAELQGWGIPDDVAEETPFLLIGPVAQICDKLERLRDTLGISHVVVRDAHHFAPVVGALAGR